MDYTLSCPACRGKVRVPASLLGKKVRCPRCQHTYRAEAPADAVDEVEVLDEPPRRRRRDHEFEDERQEYDVRPRRRRAGRARASELATPPAIALMIAGGLGLAYALVNALFAIIGHGDLLLNRFGARGAPAAVSIGYLIGVSLPFIWGIVVTFGGYKLLRLENYVSVFVAAIFSMLPCNLGCFLGIPFGIWAIVVLCQPVVRDSFQS